MIIHWGKELVLFKELGMKDAAYNRTWIFTVPHEHYCMVFVFCKQMCIPQRMHNEKQREKLLKMNRRNLGFLRFTWRHRHQVQCTAYVSILCKVLTLTWVNLMSKNMINTPLHHFYYSSDTPIYKTQTGEGNTVFMRRTMPFFIKRDCKASNPLCIWFLTWNILILESTGVHEFNQHLMHKLHFYKLFSCGWCWICLCQKYHLCKFSPLRANATMSVEGFLYHLEVQISIRLCFGKFYFFF